MSGRAPFGGKAPVIFMIVADAAYANSSYGIPVIVK